MIPHKIHYCWFGHNPLPDNTKRFIQSWKQHFPDWDIIEWNESNYDVDSMNYTSEAYKAKKYAFVSDVARFEILYKLGGLYFDTDVEIIKPMDDIVAAGSFMGYEVDPTGEDYGLVAPGLCLGSEPGLEFYKSILEMYRNRHFLAPNGELDTTTVVELTTAELKKAGLPKTPGKVKIADITIYPREYFNPFNDLTGKLHITSSTRSIHWYSKSWIKMSKWRLWLSRYSHRILGENLLWNLRRRLTKR